MTDKLPILEVFGPTIQGEGAMIGTKVMFVRTAGCDYECAWCDSRFTWDGTEKAVMMEPAEVLARLVEIGGGNFAWVTISGGNPALSGAPMAKLIDLCHAAGYEVSIETQGSVWQDWLTKVDEVVVSPKPPSSSMETDYILLKKLVENLECAGTNCSLKIVIFDETDYDYARNIKRLFEGTPLYLQVGNADVEEPGAIAGRLLARLEWLANLVIGDKEMNSVRILPQLQALIWGNQRAR